jgi:hypothetical protein
MDDKERKVLREHILWLNDRLNSSHKADRDKTVFLKRLLDPEDLGHAVSNECRQIAYTLLINSSHLERDSWQHQDNL